MPVEHRRRNLRAPHARRVRGGSSSWCDKFDAEPFVDQRWFDVTSRCSGAQPVETKTGESEPRSRAEENKEVGKRWTDALERGAFDEAVGCWAPDAVNYASGRSAPAPSRPGAIRRLMTSLRGAFPHRRGRSADMIPEGATVAGRRTVT